MGEITDKSTQHMELRIEMLASQASVGQFLFPVRLITVFGAWGLSLVQRVEKLLTLQKTTPRRKDDVKKIRLQFIRFGISNKPEAFGQLMN